MIWDGVPRHLSTEDFTRPYLRLHFGLLFNVQIYRKQPGGVQQLVSYQRTFTGSYMDTFLHYTSTRAMYLFFNAITALFYVLPHSFMFI